MFIFLLCWSSDGFAEMNCQPELFVCSFASLVVCFSASLDVCSYPGNFVCSFASMVVCSSPNLVLCSSPNLLVCSSASLDVCSLKYLLVVLSASLPSPEIHADRFFPVLECVTHLIDHLVIDKEHEHDDEGYPEDEVECLQDILEINCDLHSCKFGTVPAQVWSRGNNWHCNRCGFNLRIHYDLCLSEDLKNIEISRNIHQLLDKNCAVISGVKLISPPLA